MTMENMTDSVSAPDASGQNDLEKYSTSLSNWLGSVYRTLSTRINWLLNRYKHQSYAPSDSPIDVNEGNSFYLVDTSAGDVIANLPDASKNTGIMFHFKNTGTGELTVDGTELIDNCDTIVLIEMETITVISDGSVYWIVP